MKLCKDCKFFEEASDKEAFCLHPQALKYDDPIYGEHSRETCRSMRLGGPDRNGSCGRYGKLWVTKPGFVPTVPESI
jgi:hypothetical protein